LGKPGRNVSVATGLVYWEGVMNQLSRIRQWVVVSAALVCFAASLVAGAAESRADTVRIAMEYPQLGVSDVEFIGTDVAPAWIGLRRGDTDVLVEVDLPNQQHLLDEAEGQADVVSQLFADAGQGFFVPRFTVEGPDAPAAGLKSIDQLNEYKDVFDGTLHDESRKPMVWISST
jgi:ABC-type proline/glycine betaine transport system substrate-binding protein